VLGGGASKQGSSGRGGRSLEEGITTGRDGGAIGGVLETSTVGGGWFGWGGRRKEGGRGMRDTEEPGRVREGLEVSVPSTFTKGRTTKRKTLRRKRTRKKERKGISWDHPVTAFLHHKNPTTRSGTIVAKAEREK